MRLTPKWLLKFVLSIMMALLIFKLKWIILNFILVIVLGVKCTDCEPKLAQPNLVIILADDLGYGDLASYGHPSQEFGAIDALGINGIRFTQFYSADSMCSPSRAGLLTGQLPIRLGVVGGRRVFVPNDKMGLPTDIPNLPNSLKALGYHTGMVGKWHLGINAYNSSDGTHLPSHHGFDYVGTNLPMTVLWECDESGIFMPSGPDPQVCYLYKRDKIIQQPIKFENLTQTLVADFKTYTPAATPFFFYFPFPHVHTALWASKQFQKSSKRGLFGDNLNELHWAVGEVTKELEKRGQANNTLVLFLSDHGPHKEVCNQGGETAGLKGGKSNSFEGGFRIPALAQWPSKIEPGLVSNAVLSSLDLLPTFLSLANPEQSNHWIKVGHEGEESSKNKQKYDGIDISKYLLGQILDKGYDLLEDRPVFFYCNKHLMAVRYLQYKVHYFTSPIFSQVDDISKLECPHGTPIQDWYVEQTCEDGNLTEHDPPLVYDLEVDPFERYELDTDNENVVPMLQHISELVRVHKDSIVHVDDLLGHYDDNLFPCCDPPLCTCNYDQS